MTLIDSAQPDVAVVLGPGGMVGTAWLAGLVHGLRGQGVDLAEADLVVGTSAGAIVGAAMVTGRDLAELAELPAQSDPAPGRGADRVSEVFGILGDPALERAEALRRVGRLAMAEQPFDEDVHLAQMEYLVSTAGWPDRPLLLISAVSIETGEATVWTHESGVPLPAAVAASCAFPGAAPPITVNGSRHMDGAFRAGINADLAGAARVQIIVEPLAHLFPSDASDASVTAGPVVRISADAAAVGAMGVDLGDPAAWGPAFAAGAHQAPAAARQIKDATEHP